MHRRAPSASEGVAVRWFAMTFWLAAALFAPAAPASAQAAAPASAPVTVATWNLGWHMDRALAAQWIAACGQRFARDPADRLWKPSPSGTKTGWELRWGRNAPIAWDIAVLPPCDVYQAHFKIVPVTEAAYLKRQQQIAGVLEGEVKADLIAFQEVSGGAAVREVLPGGGADFEVCSFTGYKVQRLAIAWRRSLGTLESCLDHRPLSLPERDVKEQPRPGLALTLKIRAKRLRVLTVHLKSSCVSPLEDPRPDGKGQLDGNEPNCLILQAQIPVLEAWIENQSQGVDALILMGDFNRNIDQENHAPASAAVRTPGQPTDPHTPGTRVKNLWREVNEGQPGSSKLTLLEGQCDLAPSLGALCEAITSRVLNADEAKRISEPSALGCRNPLGLDHIALASGARADGAAKKVALGRFGRTLAPTGTRPEPLLALSDHCPLAARVWLN